MTDEFRKNLKAVNKGFINVLVQVLRKHPVIFLFFMTLIAFGLIMFTMSEQKMKFILSILISFVSILIYSKNNNYAETLLSFMLGVLTIFTITWDSYTSRLFIGFYISINIIIFFITSIKLASKVETELTVAASFINLKEHKTTYEKLNQISKMNTKYNMLGVMERAKAIKLLAYMKISINEMPEAIRNIELINVVFQLELKESCDFFNTLYFIHKRSNANLSITKLLDLIVDKRLPLMPEELLTILNRTKKEIIKEKFSIIKYLDLIDESALKGEDIEGIIQIVKNGYC
jgi:hypothetical protein